MNTASTPSDALQQLASLGYDTSGVPTTPTVNKPHRCPAPGKGKRNDAGYIHVNERTIARELQRINREQSDKSAAQQRAIRIYRAATPVTSTDDHRYLKQKRITGVIAKLGVRVDQYKGDHRLIVPIYDAAGELFTIQTINEIGGKRYFCGAGFTGGRYGAGRSPSRYPARSASAAIRFGGR